MDRFDTQKKYYFQTLRFQDEEGNEKEIEINFEKIGYLKVIEEDSREIKLALTYRKKASVKEYTFSLRLPEEGNERFKRLAKFGLYRLENYIININNIVFADHETDKNKSKIVFYFVDGQHLQVNTTKPRWEAWRNTRM